MYVIKTKFSTRNIPNNKNYILNVDRKSEFFSIFEQRLLEYTGASSDNIDWDPNGTQLVFVEPEEVNNMSLEEFTKIIDEKVNGKITYSIDNIPCFEITIDSIVEIE